MAKNNPAAGAPESTPAAAPAAPVPAPEPEPSAKPETIRIEVMRDCWCSEASLKHLPPPATEKQKDQPRKLLKGGIVDLHPDDAELLHKRQFVRIAWPGKGHKNAQ